MLTLAKVASTVLFLFVPVGTFSFVPPVPDQDLGSGLPGIQGERMERPAMDKRQRAQAARDYDLIQCRYLLGLLDQEWTKTYNSGDARPPKDTVKHLRKEARTAGKAVTRLIVDLSGAKVPVKLDGPALSDHMPHDFISTLRSVNEELGTFGHSWAIDSVQQQTLVTDLRLLATLLNRF